MSTNPLHTQLARIERAYYYRPGAMTSVHAVSGTISPRPSAATDPTTTTTTAEAAAAAGTTTTTTSTAIGDGRPNQRRPMCIVSGNGNRPLAEAVALLLGVRTHNTSVTQYASGEVNVRINESVLGTTVYIIQSTTGNEVVDLNTSLMELMILIRKMKLSNAKSITVIVPFFGYARQDRKTELRGPISASAVAEMIVRMGADRVTTLDLHSNQIQGFFENTPLDNLQMAHEFARFIRSLPWFDPEKMVIVSPDAGGVERARKLADLLGVGGIVTIVKRRIAAGKVDTMQTVGEVNGLHCVIVDDMVDTGGTLVKACELLKQLGALSVYACCTHGILTSPCAERVNACDALEGLVVSDSIPQEEHQKAVSKLKVLTIAPLIAVVIDKYCRNESISSLFDAEKEKV